VAYSCATAGDRDSLSLHLERAEALLDPGLDGGFRSLWHLAAGMLSMRLLDPTRAERYFERGLSISAGEPSLLVALGSSLEEQATLPTRPRELWERNLTSRERQVLQRSRLAKAVSLYEEALRANPSHAEARLRLGRAHLRAGRVEEGLAHVEWVVRNGGEADLRYVAHMLRGREREQRGDVKGGAESYAEAHAVDPRGQVAQIALSHALSASGDREGAQAALLLALPRPEPVPVDPWRGFDRGRDALLGAAIAVLLQAVVTS
jgi:tetratricopeptide (TPR) repeat protein